MPQDKPAKLVADESAPEAPPDRRPSRSEQLWMERTLAPTLEKSPEKPIGAPTGTNRDEHGHARFSTISNVPIRRLYTQAHLPADWRITTGTSDIPDNRLIRAAFTPPATAASSGPCACSRGLLRPRRRTNATSTCWSTVVVDFRSPLICPL